MSAAKDARIIDSTRYGEAGPGPAGTVMTVRFELAGQEFVGVNGGPLFPFTEAVSFAIDCEDQVEVDYFWEKLSEGGGRALNPAVHRIAISARCARE